MLEWLRAGVWPKWLRSALYIGLEWRATRKNGPIGSQGFRFVLLSDPYVQDNSSSVVTIWPIYSIRYLTKLHLISFGLISHLCLGFQAITNFTILFRKIVAATTFRTLRFSVTSLFFSLTMPEGASELYKFCKNAKNRDLDDSLQFTFSCSLWVCLASQPAPSEFNKFCENGEKSGPQLLFSLYDLSLMFCFSQWLSRRRFRIQQILRKWQEIVDAQRVLQYRKSALLN